MLYTMALPQCSSVAITRNVAGTMTPSLEKITVESTTRNTTKKTLENSRAGSRLKIEPGGRRNSASGKRNAAETLTGGDAQSAWIECISRRMAGLARVASGSVKELESMRGQSQHRVVWMTSR